MIQGSRTRGEAERPVPPRGRAIDWIRSHSAIVEALAAIPVAAVLFVLYHHLAATIAFNSDFGFLPLQAHDMLSGNPTARGWIGPQDTFFLTELPVYLAAVAVHGLSPTAVNVVSAAYYTLTTLAIVALARAGLPRREQPLAMLVAFGLVAAPAYPSGAQVLIPGPGHMGTMLFVLAAVLCLYTSHRHARASLVALAVVLLTLTVASDPIALYAGVLPIALVHGVRLAWRMPRGALDDGVDLGTAVLGGALGVVGGRILYAGLGYQVIPVATAFAPLTEIPASIENAINNWLPMFGAQFLGQPLTLHTGLSLFRLLGYGFTVAACVIVGVQSIRALRRQGPESAADPLVLSQTLLAVVLCDLAAVTLSTDGSHDGNGRYLIPSVLAGAALAGRVAPTMLSRLRWRTLGAAISICYIALLPLSLRYQASPVPEYGIATWLQAHDLNHGMAEYWSASSITVTSGDKVQVRAVVDVNGKLGPYWWVVNRSWYGPGAYANFVVIDTSGYSGVTEASATATFGAPASETQVDGYTVMVWNHNLLPELGPGAE